MPNAANTVRIVGLGSPGAGDDQLGLVAVQRLRQLLPGNVLIGEDTSGGTRLAEWCEGVDSLYVIDAAYAQAEWPAGSHLRLLYPADADRLKDTGFRGTHSLSLLEALRLADVLGILPQTVVIHALAAEQFALGTPLSRTLQTPLDQLIDTIRNEVRSGINAADA